MPTTHEEPQYHVYVDIEDQNKGRGHIYYVEGSADEQIADAVTDYINARAPITDRAFYDHGMKEPDLPIYDQSRLQEPKGSTEPVTKDLYELER